MHACLCNYRKLGMLQVLFDKVVHLLVYQIDGSVLGPTPPPAGASPASHSRRARAPRHRRPHHRARLGLLSVVVCSTPPLSLRLYQNARRHRRPPRGLGFRRGPAAPLWSIYPGPLDFDPAVCFNSFIPTVPANQGAPRGHFFYSFLCFSVFRQKFIQTCKIHIS